MATTQAAVKAALKAALLARTLISTGHIQVAYGEPADTGRRECIWIGTSFEAATHEHLAMRKGRREEDYTLRVHCEAGLQETPEKTEARAVVLAEEVEQAVEDSTTLGVTDVSWIVSSGVELATREVPDGPSSTATVLLSVKARLL